MNGRDDDALLIVDGILQFRRVITISNGFYLPHLMVKAKNSILQLIVQDSAVSHHKHRLEHLFVFQIMQWRKPVGQPSNGVRLATTSTVLQQIAFALLLCFRFSNQFLYYVQLMIAWEDNLLRLCGHLLAIHQFYLLLHLQTNVSLQQSQQHIPTQHLFP